MVTFDAALPGTTRAEWAADARWNDLPAVTLTGVDRVIVAAAHPDDESLGAGGLIAECFDQGIPVTVVVVTNGDASHPHSPTIDAETMARRRSVEVHEAVELLAPGCSVHELGLPDGRLDAHLDVIREHIARLAVLPTAPRPAETRDARGRTLLVCPWRGDGHPDHRMLGDVCAGLAAELGLELLEYPIWLWHWGSPNAADTPWATFVRLPLSEWSAVSKDRAISAHRSQIAPLSRATGDAAVLHPTFLANFDRDDEIFVRAVPRASTPPHAEPDALPDEKPDALPAAFFDQTYATSEDPWGFTSRWYEERKRSVTMAALPRQRYRSAYEIGCSIGVLTAELATRCEALLAVDISPAAVERARQRVLPASASAASAAFTPGAAAARASAPLGEVSIEVADATRSFAAGPFDLIIVSEVAYYWSANAFAHVLGDIGTELSPDGHLIACHWRHEVTEYPRGGDEVHDQLAAHAEAADWNHLVHHVEDDFVLDVYSPSGQSAAGETGLL